MWCTHREMYSIGGALGKDHIEVKGDKLYREQVVRTLEREHRITRENRG